MDPFDLKIGKLTVRVENGAYEKRHGGVKVYVRRSVHGCRVTLDAPGAYGSCWNADPAVAVRLALASYRRDAREILRAIDPKRVAKTYDDKIAALRKKIATTTKARTKALAAAKKCRPLVETRVARALEAFR